MQRIDVRVFKGMAPRVSPGLLENEQGVDVVGSATSGELRPWNMPKFVQDCLPDTRSIYLTAQGDWLTWNEVVQPHPAPQANDAFGRIYYTRESGGLFVVSPLDGYQEYTAGVPQPIAPPTVVVAGSGSGTIEDRVYLYTYVNDWGEEGPPSEPSEFHEWQEGKTVTLSDFAVPPLDFHPVVAIRIYRLGVGESLAEWFYVDEIPADQETYVDAVPDGLLGEALSTAEYTLPQIGARGLVPVGSGVFATFQGNEVAFSEPYLPYAWPDGYRMTVAGSVVALGVIGDSVVVLTNVNPVYIRTAHPSSSRLVPSGYGQSPLAEVTPCVSPYGVCSTEVGVIFPAPDGLRVLQGDGPSSLLTEALITAREWVPVFDPVEVRAIYYDGTYFGWSGDKGFSYHVRTNVLTWTGLSVSAMHTDGLDMYIVREGSIQLWGGDLGLMEGRFRSKVYRYDRPVNFSAVRVDSSLDPIWAVLRDQALPVIESNLATQRDVLSLTEEEVLEYSVGGDNLLDLPYWGGNLAYLHVRIWADGALCFDAELDDSGFARLPGGFLAREWQWEIASHAHVKQFTMATSMRTLRGS